MKDIDIYKVIITPTETNNRFTVTWLDMDAETGGSFKKSAEKIIECLKGDAGNLWQISIEDRLEIGRRLFRFLDGDKRYLRRALDKTHLDGKYMLLYLQTCIGCEDWPFELLAKKDVFLLPGRLHLVRRLSNRGEKKRCSPKKRPLKLLFMVCSPLVSLQLSSDGKPTARRAIKSFSGGPGGRFFKKAPLAAGGSNKIDATLDKPVPDYHREEEYIFREMDEVAIHIDVEDSGSLAGLREKLTHRKYDVVHLSGDMGIDEPGTPYFIMESESGDEHRVTPGDLWNKALKDNPPRLLFLSGPGTGCEPFRTAAASFAHIMIEKHDIPAVLEWNHPVDDPRVGQGTGIFYRELARGMSIPAAIQRVRSDLVEKEEEGEEGDKKPQDDFNCIWPLLRLFSDGTPLKALVKKGQQQGVNDLHGTLASIRRPVKEEGFVGRRRQLQHGVRVLKHQDEKSGVLILGTAGLGKSRLAIKMCRRLKDYHAIIHQGKLDEASLKKSLMKSFRQKQDKKGIQILESGKTIEEKLIEICATCFKKSRYLLVLDDFEHNLEKNGGGGSVFVLSTEAVELLDILLQYLPFCEKQTRLIITCRYGFSLQEDDRDLVTERLETILLNSFHRQESRRMALLLTASNNVTGGPLVGWLMGMGQGNPGLMAEIAGLLADNPQLIAPCNHFSSFIIHHSSFVEPPLAAGGKTNPEQLTAAAAEKKEAFIKDSGLRELLDHDGIEERLVSFLRCSSVLRRPVDIEGIDHIAKTAALEGWEELLKEAVELGLIEYCEVRHAYLLTSLLREELLPAPENRIPFHKTAFYYYRDLSRIRKEEPELAEECIFHALGCGRVQDASRVGGALVKLLRDRLLQFHDARDTGAWILSEIKKKQDFSTVHDAVLLNETALTLKYLGEYAKAAEYFQQSHAIDAGLYGKTHEYTTRDLNNLGAVRFELGDWGKAVEIFEEILPIVKEINGAHSQAAVTVLNNLGAALSHLDKHDEAIRCLEEALRIMEAAPEHGRQNMARTLNNLGFARQKSGELQKALEYYRKAFAIDRELHAVSHPDIAKDLSNLASVLAELGQPRKAADYYRQALRISRNYHGDMHPDVAIILTKLGKVLGLR